MVERCEWGEVRREEREGESSRTPRKREEKDGKERSESRISVLMRRRGKVSVCVSSLRCSYGGLLVVHLSVCSVRWRTDALRLRSHVLVRATACPLTCALFPLQAVEVFAFCVCHSSSCTFRSTQVALTGLLTILRRRCRRRTPRRRTRSRSRLCRSLRCRPRRLSDLQLCPNLAHRRRSARARVPRRRLRGVSRVRVYRALRNQPRAVYSVQRSVRLTHIAWLAPATPVCAHVVPLYPPSLVLPPSARSPRTARAAPTPRFRGFTAVRVRLLALR